jgi:hypothetical protein
MDQARFSGCFFVFHNNV